MIKVTGQKFGSNLSLRAPEAASLTSGAPQPVAGKVTVVSDSEATVALPTSINFGLFTLSFLQDGVEQNVTLLSNGGKTDYPVMVTVPEKICTGDKFYDEAGVLRTGTKDCAAASLPSCSQDGAVDCKATKDFVAADASKALASSIATGVTLAGVVGTAALENHADCSADGVTGCVTVTGYPSAKLANFTASNVQSGTTIAGVVGGATSIASPCTADGQQNCAVSGVFKAANVTGISTWDLRSGLSLGGVTGALKTNCRNTIDSSRFNHDTIGTLGTAADITGTAADHWDTVDDSNGLSSTQVTGWSSDTYCDSTTFTDVTTTNGGSTTVACGTSNTCIYKDNISNLKVTGILATGGNTTTATPAAFTWPEAVQICAASTYGGYTAGSWRLPTQKELMSLYEHGFISLNSANFGSIGLLGDENFWSSSSTSTSTTYAWAVNLATGHTTGSTNAKIIANYAVCVR